MQTYARATNAHDKKEKTTNRLLRTWNKFRLKKALAAWRSNEFLEMVTMIEETTEATNQMIQGHDMKVENIKKHRQAVQSGKKLKDNA